MRAISTDRNSIGVIARMAGSLYVVFGLFGSLICWPRTPG